ncbi:MAG: response regulator, partial [Acidimicrobiales bacterium]
IEISGEGASGNEAIALVQQDPPDVVLMDVEMPGLDGIAATRHITNEFPRAKVIILTTFERDDYIRDALEAGASGFLLKTTGPEDLTHAIHVVADGESLLSPAVTVRVIRQLVESQSAPTPTPEVLKDLTERELEVLRLLAEGLSNSELAERLTLGESTIKTHISNLLTKLGLRDRVQAVAFAYQQGIAITRSS